MPTYKELIDQANEYKRQAEFILKENGCPGDLNCSSCFFYNVRPIHNECSPLRVVMLAKQFLR